MENRKYIINNIEYNLPFKTTKEVIKFINTDFRYCPYCGKIDCSLEHVSNCSLSNAQYKQMNDDNYWK